MRIGKTIGGARERVESSSERTRHREKVKRRKLISTLTYLTILAIIVLGAIVAVSNLREKSRHIATDEGVTTAVEPTVEITDEAGVGVSRRIREFVGYIEGDLSGYGYKLTRAVLPRDKTREVDIYIEEFSGYFKLSLDRGAGVSAEDVDRMVRYLRGLGIIGVEYVDLRVEGKGYYRGEFREEITEVETEVEPVYEVEYLEDYTDYGGGEEEY